MAGLHNNTNDPGFHLVEFMNVGAAVSRRALFGRQTRDTRLLVIIVVMIFIRELYDFFNERVHRSEVRTALDNIDNFLY